MARFRFIHAADLHLDSPLAGLASKSQDYAARLDDASRLAFDNLVALAIEEECRLIVIAGDIFDGQWRDYRTGLFFVDRMRPLREASIRVVMIPGNHDAETRFDTCRNIPTMSGFCPPTAQTPCRLTSRGRSSMDEAFRNATSSTTSRSPVGGREVQHQRTGGSRCARF
jgi:hypothetical protein